MTGTIRLGYVGLLLVLSTFLLFCLCLELKEMNKTFKNIETELIKLNNNGINN